MSLLATAAEPPLDTRIDASKVTTLPAPTVSSVADPVRATAPEPVLRIAAKASDVPLSEERYALARKAVRAGLEFLAQRQSPRGTWRT